MPAGGHTGHAGGHKIPILKHCGMDDGDHVAVNMLNDFFITDED